MSFGTTKGREKSPGPGAKRLAAGQNPTDFWLAPVGLGYPFFHHYQHLAYLPLAGLHFLWSFYADRA